VFKLDSDFDLLIDDTGVSILRPSGFEFVGDLQEAILAAAPANVKLIQTDLPFVDFTPIQTYASEHPRPARYLASIRVQKETKGIDKGYLKKLCVRTGVKVRDVNGKLIVEDGSIMDFLGVLDRRLYQLELVAGLEATPVSIAIAILERLHRSHPLLIATSGLSPVRSLIVVRIVFTPFMPALRVTIAVALLIAILTRLPRIALMVATIVIIVVVLRE
jgi:hypothetical protein